MSVTITKTGPADSEDVMEAVFCDDEGPQPVYTVFRISGEALRDAAARGGMASWDLIMNHVQGTLDAIVRRKQNIPACGDAVFTKAADGEFIIVRIDRSTMTVGLYPRRTERDEATVLEAAWEDCRFA